VEIPLYWTALSTLPLWGRTWLIYMRKMKTSQSDFIYSSFPFTNAMLKPPGLLTLVHTTHTHTHIMRGISPQTSVQGSQFSPIHFHLAWLGKQKWAFPLSYTTENEYRHEEIDSFILLMERDTGLQCQCFYILCPN